MKHATWKIALRLCCALGLAAAASAAHSQGLRKIGSAAQPAAPTAPATFGLPNPAGLPSPFPAGLPAPATTGGPLAAGTAFPPVPGMAVTGGGNPLNNQVPGVQTNVMGAGAGGGVGLPRLAAGAGASGRFSAVDIARSFIEADGNRDGELTRAEAARLTIVPYSFEEMDRNRDGVLSRFEYDDATR